MPDDCRTKPKQAILFRITAWNVNCPHHIPQKLDATEVGAAVARLTDRIAALESENAVLSTIEEPL